MLRPALFFALFLALFPFSSPLAPIVLSLYVICWCELLAVARFVPAAYRIGIPIWIERLSLLDSWASLPEQLDAQRVQCGRYRRADALFFYSEYPVQRDSGLFFPSLVRGAVRPSQSARMVVFRVSFLWLTFVASVFVMLASDPIAVPPLLLPFLVAGWCLYYAISLRRDLRSARTVLEAALEAR